MVVPHWLARNRDGEPLGFQVTFFRNRPGVDEDNPSRFVARQVLFAHAAVSDPRRGALMRGEKSARAGFGLAEAAEGSLAVKIDDWSLRQDGERYLAVAATSEFALRAGMHRTQPPLLQRQDGFSQKGPQPQFASYYYSLPQLRASGRIVIGGREHRVRGVAWFDHEWSSSMFDETRARLGLDRSQSRRRRRADGSAHSRRCRRRSTGAARRCATPRQRGPYLRAGRDRVVATASLALAAHRRRLIPSNGKSRWASAR